MIRLPVQISGDATGLKRAVEDAAKAGESLAGRFGKMSGKVKAALGAASILAIGRGLAQSTQEAAQFAGDMQDIATETGAAVAEVQALEIAARNAGLGGASSFVPMIARIREMQDAMKAGGEAGVEASEKFARAFGSDTWLKQSGLIAGLSPWTIVDDLAISLAEAGENGERSAAIFEIMGDKARKMQNFMKGIGAGGGLAGLAKGMEGQIMSDDQVRALDQFDQLLQARKAARRKDLADAFTAAGDSPTARAAFALTQEALMDPLGTVAAQVTSIFNWLKDSALGSAVGAIGNAIEYVGQGIDELVTAVKDKPVDGNNGAEF